MICGVAYRYPDGLVISLPKPNRHHNLHPLLQENNRNHLTSTLPWKMCIEEQGFYDEEGVFYNRKEAKIHALACNQRIIYHENGYVGDELFSECLW
jgi:hypothetical protein